MITIDQTTAFQGTALGEARITRTRVFGGLGAALTDAEINAMADGLAKADYPDYSGAFANIGKEDRKRLVAALLARKPGDSWRINNAANVAGWRDFSGSTGGTVWRVLAFASFVASAYHGAKRHPKHPVLGALGWGLMGSLFPVITPIVAFAAPPGYAKPKQG